MSTSIPTVLLPGLLCSPLLYQEQLPLLWRYGPVMIGDTRHDDNLSDMAKRVLQDAPERFALVGFSMGGYLSLEIMRQAPERIIKLALLDTSARADVPQAIEGRKKMFDVVKQDGLQEVFRLGYEFCVHSSRKNDQQLRNDVYQMMVDVGEDAYIRQQTAIFNRIDSRPSLAQIPCQTLVLVGDSDQLTTVGVAKEMAGGIHHAELVIVPECGHISPLEKPEAVNVALVRWMESTW